MEKVNVKVRKWGNSFGVILPKDVVNSQNIKEGLEVEITIQPKNKTKARALFGLLKGKLGNTEKLIKEVDKELWDIER
jgi:antitoxin component of MazEF toxin-antitoxin module